MSYPNEFIFSLYTIDGNACGPLGHIFNYVEGSNPPKYEAVYGEGDFSIGYITRISAGNGQYTWQAKIRYTNWGTPCAGYWTLIRTQANDDPIGDYCIVSSGVMDCTKGTGVAEGML